MDTFVSDVNVRHSPSAGPTRGPPGGAPWSTHPPPVPSGRRPRRAPARDPRTPPADRTPDGGVRSRRRRSGPSPPWVSRGGGVPSGGTLLPDLPSALPPTVTKG